MRTNLMLTSPAFANGGIIPPKLYSPLREVLALGAGATKKEVLSALAPLLIGETELIGRYSRK